MKIAKPLLLVATPVGLAIGLYEAHRLAGGLVFIMAALITVIGVAMASVVLTVRRERREEEARKAAANPASGSRRDTSANAPADPVTGHGPKASA